MKRRISLILCLVLCLTAFTAPAYAFRITKAQKAYAMGVSEDFDPFITLSFMALTVIPELRVTPRGLYRVSDKGSGFIK